MTLYDHAGEIVASASLGTDPNGEAGFVFHVEHTDDYLLEVEFEPETLSAASVKVH